MSIEAQLDEVRKRVARMSKQAALDWQGAFIGALCVALDNPQKWNLCLKTADFALDTASEAGISSVITKE